MMFHSTTIPMDLLYTTIIGKPVTNPREHIKPLQMYGSNSKVKEPVASQSITSTEDVLLSLVSNLEEFSCVIRETVSSSSIPLLRPNAS